MAHYPPPSNDYQQLCRCRFCGTQFVWTEGRNVSMSLCSDQCARFARSVDAEFKANGYVVGKIESAK